MVQAVIHQTLTTEAHAQTQASLCWTGCGLTETGTGYCVLQFLPVCNISLLIHSFIHH